MLRNPMEIDNSEIHSNILRASGDPCSYAAIRRMLVITTEQAVTRFSNVVNRKRVNVKFSNILQGRILLRRAMSQC